MHRGVIQQLASPKEIYQRPVNRFVAGFVGSPAMNFVSGELVANSDPVLRTADGTEIRLAGYPFNERPQSGRKVDLGVRPEQIHFDSTAPGATALPLALTLVEPMGADSLLWGSIGDQSVSLRIGPDETHKIGEKVNVHFQPAAASIFDAETGERL
jgi:multiple sugar transport system ATP-binding protein